MLNSFGTASKGCVAVGVGLIKSAKASMPDAEITMWSLQASEDMSWEQYGIKVEQHPWAIRGRSRLFSTATGAIRVLSILVYSQFSRFLKKLSKGVKPPYAQYDVVIDPSMDGINDRYLGISTPVRTLTFTLLAQMIIRKPIALVPASIGPFGNKSVKRLAKFVLNRDDVITVRGEISKDYLQKLGVNRPKIYLAADLGFLLDPAPPERVGEILRTEGIGGGNKLLIGLSPSQEMGSWAFIGHGSKESRRDKYLELMSKITDHLIEKLDAVVCFIPHHGVTQYYDTDDRIACKKIIERVRNKQAVRLISGEYKADELKGIIGSCDMFVGCRMHPCIASTSLSIPTVAISYGLKFNDVIGSTMGQENCIVSVDDQDFDEVLLKLKSTVDYVWENKVRIKEELKENSKIARDRALLFGQVVKEMVESKKKA